MSAHCQIFMARPWRPKPAVAFPAIPFATSFFGKHFVVFREVYLLSLRGHACDSVCLLLKIRKHIGSILTTTLGEVARSTR